MSDNKSKIDEMFPQVTLTASGPAHASSQEPEPEASLDTQEQDIEQSQLLYADFLRRLDSSMEITLACTMARVAFFGVAVESDDPSGVITQTMSTWLNGEREKVKDAPAELKIAVWEKLESFARAQEEHLLGALDQ